VKRNFEGLGTINVNYVQMRCLFQISFRDGASFMGRTLWKWSRDISN
jgi:hypothetical protein